MQPLMSEDEALPRFQQTPIHMDAIFRRLQWLHLSAGVFFIVQTVIYAVVGASATVHLTVAFPTFESGPIGTPHQREVGSWNPTFLIAMFVGLAAVDHTLTWLVCVCAPEVARRWLFEIKSNPFRWIEYTFSAAAMKVAIAILAGVNDVHLLYSMFMLTALGMCTGQLLEILPVPRQDFSSRKAYTAESVTLYTFSMGSLIIAAPWAVSVCYFSQTSPPDFVYAAFFGTLVLFATFGLNSYLHHVKGWYDFHTAEMIYVVLSFTAKTFLAADVFGGLRAN